MLLSMCCSSETYCSAGYVESFGSLTIVIFGQQVRDFLHAMIILCKSGGPMQTAENFWNVFGLFLRTTSMAEAELPVISRFLLLGHVGFVSRASPFLMCRVFITMLSKTLQALLKWLIENSSKKYRNDPLSVLWFNYQLRFVYEDFDRYKHSTNEAANLWPLCFDIARQHIRKHSRPSWFDIKRKPCLINEINPPAMTIPIFWYWQSIICYCRLL